MPPSAFTVDDLEWEKIGNIRERSLGNQRREELQCRHFESSEIDALRGGLWAWLDWKMARLPRDGVAISEGAVLNEETGEEAGASRTAPNLRPTDPHATALAPAAQPRPAVMGRALPLLPAATWESRFSVHRRDVRHSADLP
jgi:hypothetical protein